MPTFTVHAESRHGATIHETVDNILEAAMYAVEYTALPKGVMTKTFLVTDETGFDVTTPLFDVLMSTAGANPNIDPETIPAEEIQLAYNLALMKYRRLLGEHIARCDHHASNGWQITVDQFAEALNSGDFEASLAQFLAAPADGDEDGESPSAPEGTGQ